MQKSQTQYLKRDTSDERLLLHNFEAVHFQFSQYNKDIANNIDQSKEVKLIISFSCVIEQQENMDYDPAQIGLQTQGEGVYTLIGSVISKVKNIQTFEIESCLDINMSLYEEIEIRQKFNNSNNNDVQYGFSLKKYHQKIIFLTNDKQDRERFKKSILSYVVQLNIKNDFEFLKNIGKGAFGIVKLAQSQNNEHQPNNQQIKCGILQQNQRVAVKVMYKRQILETSSGLQGLISEIQIHQSLVLCENTLKLLSTYENDNKIYLVLEYQEHGSLLDNVLKRQTFSEKSLKSIIQQLLLAVDFMHRKHIIHRDIKLDNILVNKVENELYDLRLADFGISVNSNGQKVYKKCGTPGYLPPEMFLNQGYDSKSDIFSLGVTFYCLVTFKNLFKGKGKDKIVNNAKCDLSFLKNVLKQTSLSEDGQHLMRKMLNRDPANRPNAQQALQHEWFKDDQKVIQDLIDLNDKMCSSPTSSQTKMKKGFASNMSFGSFQFRSGCQLSDSIKGSDADLNAESQFKTKLLNQSQVMQTIRRGRSASSQKACVEVINYYQAIQDSRQQNISCSIQKDSFRVMA